MTKTPAVSSRTISNFSAGAGVAPKKPAGRFTKTVTNDSSLEKPKESFQSRIRIQPPPKPNSSPSRSITGTHPKNAAQQKSKQVFASKMSARGDNSARVSSRPTNGQKSSLSGASSSSQLFAPAKRTSTPSYAFSARAVDKIPTQQKANTGSSTSVKRPTTPGASFGGSLSARSKSQTKLLPSKKPTTPNPPKAQKASTTRILSTPSRPNTPKPDAHQKKKSIDTRIPNQNSSSAPAPSIVTSSSFSSLALDLSLSPLDNAGKEPKSASSYERFVVWADQQSLEDFGDPAWTKEGLTLETGMIKFAESLKELSTLLEKSPSTEQIKNFVSRAVLCAKFRERFLFLLQKGSFDASVQRDFVDRKIPGFLKNIEKFLKAKELLLFFAFAEGKGSFLINNKPAKPEIEAAFNSLSAASKALFLSVVRSCTRELMNSPDDALKIFFSRNPEKDFQRTMNLQVFKLRPSFSFTLIPGDACSSSDDEKI